MDKNLLSKYKAVILAGGKGTRLYPITKEVPKPLLPVHKKPIINYLVDLFHQYGIRDIAILIGRDFKEDFLWWQKRYYEGEHFLIVEEEEPLGTFGGLGLLKPWLLSSDDLDEAAPFFLTNGDELKKIDLGAMDAFHRNSGASATIALVKVPNPQDYGVVLCTNEGRVYQFLEKPQNPPSQYISSGLYLCSPHIFAYHQGSKFSMIEKDIFPKLAESGQLAGFQFEGAWMDCGTWERYEKALTQWSDTSETA